MRILITNNGLALPGGTEMYVRDIALELRRRGHAPVVYSTQLGRIAENLRTLEIEVVNDLRDVTGTPDVIHGHHHIDAMTALLHFPDVPAVHFCHGARSWLEVPVIFPRILRYVGVDDVCKDYLLRCGIRSEKIRVLLNSVDLNRFRQRDAPLASPPRRALVFSNYANESTHVPAVRQACELLNIELDVLGHAADTAVANPETVLGKYEIVFAKARCALESMAVGAAVVLCDASGVGPMVTTAEFNQLRPLNFGFRTLCHPLDPLIIREQIERYDPVDAAAVSRLVRVTASHEALVDELIDLYEEVIDEHRENASIPSEESRAAGLYLRQLRMEFFANRTVSMRLRERLENVPLIGKLASSFLDSRTTKNPTAERSSPYIPQQLPSENSDFQ